MPLPKKVKSPIRHSLRLVGKFLSSLPKPQSKPQPKPTDYIVKWISPVDCPFCSYSATRTVTFIWEPFEQTTVEFPVKPCWAHNPEVTKNFGQHPGKSNSHSSSS